ncbi:MAG: methionyl-tRNA formyltransferase [Deltaproteobacteria bacterium]|nr:methionyl-tRNA formyltransferase [Deltaproteobacteria bacterium]
MRVAFMGTLDLAAACLRALAGAHEVALVVCQPDKPAGRGAQLTAPPVKVLADELGLPVIQPKSARTGELRDALKASGAELAVVVAYGKILPKDVLEALPRGCINVHVSLLPKYRGAAPVQWAVINGDAETGISIMQLDEGMDTGPVLFEKRVAIDPAWTSGDLFEHLKNVAPPTMLEALAQIEAGRAEPRPQDHAHATHARMLEKKDGAIDFTRPAREVAARILGVDPWPGAQATLRGQVIKLFRARAVAGSGAPGTVVAIDAEGAHVACGQGAVVIRELQLPGKKRMPAQALVNGRALAVGDVLGTPELA